MTAPTPTSPGADPNFPPPPITASTQPGRAVPVIPPALATWLDRQAGDGIHPDVVGRRLERAGYTHPGLFHILNRYRELCPQNQMGWTALFWTVGICALALTGFAHELIVAADHGISVRATGAAGWFTFFVVSAPFAAVSLWWQHGARRQPGARTSEPRRTWSTVLFGAAVTVGVIRGFLHASELSRALFGDPPPYRTCVTEFCAQPGTSAGAAAGHLALSLVVAGTVAAWAWFGHRRPTDPPAAGSR